MIKAIIFDIDGTLYESRHFPIKLILADPLHIGMLAKERQCRKRLQGKFFEEKGGYYAALFNAMSSNPEKCRKWFYESYMPCQVDIIRKSMPKREHLKELMATLRKQGIKIAVLSDYAMAAEKLSACGLEPSDFDAVWESPDLGGLKPCKEVFVRACEALGTEPSETLMVGDKLSTDGGAMAVGMQFIHIVNKTVADNGQNAQVSSSAKSAVGTLVVGTSVIGPSAVDTSTAIKENAPYREMIWSELLSYLTSLPAKDSF